MKKTLSFMLLAAMFISPGLYPSATAYAEEPVPMSGGEGEAGAFSTGYAGQVSKIEGYLVTLTLGSFEGAANKPEGESPERPEGGMQMPQSDGMQPTQGEGQPPIGDMQMSHISMQQSDENGRMPGGRGRSGFGAGAGGAEPGIPFGGAGYVSGSETMSFDLENAAISRQSEKGTEDCAFEDISLGDILVIETDENDNALSVLIISPTEAEETPPEKPEDTV